MAAGFLKEVRILGDFWGICWLQKEFISFRFTLMILEHVLTMHIRLLLTVRLWNQQLNNNKKKLGRLNKRLIKVREDDRTDRKGVCQGSEFSFASA